MKSCLSFVVLLSIGLVLAVELEPLDVVTQTISALENDDFSTVEVSVDSADSDARKKRSAGPYVGNYLPFSGVGYGDNSGYYSGHGYNHHDSRPNVNFVQSFHPGKVIIEKNHIVRNYYKQGNYQKALKYFYAIPLIKVAKSSKGYVGHFQKKRSYTVSICKSCYQGHPQIEVRCNTKPYSYLVRRFNFMPQINNVNYNNYNNYNHYSVEHPTYQQGYKDHPSYVVSHPYYYQQEHPSYQPRHPVAYAPISLPSYGYQDNSNYVNQANFGPRDNH